MELVVLALIFPGIELKVLWLELFVLVKSFFQREVLPDGLELK